MNFDAAFDVLLKHEGLAEDPRWPSYVFGTKQSAVRGNPLAQKSCQALPNLDGTLRSGIYSSAAVGGKYSSAGNPSARDDGVTTNVAWSASSTWFSGARGRGEYPPSAFNASGGVGGFIRIEYIR